jgi:hypothetical protein
MSAAFRTPEDYELFSIKHHRVPAPQMSFTRPNLPVLIEEIGAMLAEAP